MVYYTQLDTRRRASYKPAVWRGRFYEAAEGFSMGVCTEGGIPLPAQASFLFLYRKTRKGVVGMSITILKGTVVSAPALGKLDITENGCLVAEDGKITGVFPALPEQYAGAAVEDYGDALILQSFADLHLHAPQYPMLGMGMDLPLLDWLNTYTFPTEARFADPDYAREEIGRAHV